MFCYCSGVHFLSVQRPQFETFKLIELQLAIRKDYRSADIQHVPEVPWASNPEMRTIRRCVQPGDCLPHQCEVCRLIVLSRTSRSGSPFGAIRCSLVSPFISRLPTIFDCESKDTVYAYQRPYNLFPLPVGVLH